MYNFIKCVLRTLRIATAVPNNEWTFTFIEKARAYNWPTHWHLSLATTKFLVSFNLFSLIVKFNCELSLSTQVYFQIWNFNALFLSVCLISALCYRQTNAAECHLSANQTDRVSRRYATIATSLHSRVTSWTII